MNPMAQVDPPDEPPVSWQLRDLGRRLSEAEARMTANEQRVGGEIEVNIRRDEQINGEFGLVAAMRANTAAIEKNTSAIEADRLAAVKLRDERAQFMRRTAVGFVVSLLLIVAAALVTGALQ